MELRFKNSEFDGRFLIITGDMLIKEEIEALQKSAEDLPYKISAIMFLKGNIYHEREDGTRFRQNFGNNFVVADKYGLCVAHNYMGSHGHKFSERLKWSEVFSILNTK